MASELNAKVKADVELTSPVISTGQGDTRIFYAQFGQHIVKVHEGKLYIKQYIEHKFIWVEVKHA